MAKKKKESFNLKERAKDTVLKSIGNSEKTLNQYFNKYTKFYQLYRNFQSDKSYNGRANLFVPEVFSHIETVHARVMRAFQGVRVKPQGEDDIKGAKQIERLLEYQTRVFNYKQAFKDMDKDAHIYGTGILKASWVFTKDGKRDHPLLEVVDPGDYFWDPNATSRQNARFEIHRQHRTLQEIMDNPNYDKDTVTELKRIEPASTGEGDAGSAMKNVRRSTQGISSKDNKGKFEILEYWGQFREEEGGEEKEYLITVANRTHVLRVEENPFLEIFKDGIVDEMYARPFVLQKDTDIPHEYVGMGMVEPVVKLQEELNDTRNQRMDNVTDVIDHMWQVIDGADIDENELVRRPGGIVHTAIPNGVSPLAPGDVTQSAYQEEQIIKQDIQNALGIPAVATGSLQGQQGETATTVLSLQESANVRFDVKISNFADAVRDAYTLLLAYNQKWMDNEVVIRLEGKEAKEEIEAQAAEAPALPPELAGGLPPGLPGGAPPELGAAPVPSAPAPLPPPEEMPDFAFVKMSKEDIAGKVDMDVQMQTQMNKIVIRQEAFQVFNTLAASPMYPQEENLRQLLESLDRPDLVANVGKVPPPPPPAPEEPKKSISVNLKGDLNALESDDIAVIMGAKQESADPLMRPELRELMEEDENGVGQTSESALKKLEIEEKIAEEQRLSRALDLKEREIRIKEAEVGIKAPPPTPEPKAKVEDDNER